MRKSPSRRLLLWGAPIIALAGGTVLVASLLSAPPADAEAATASSAAGVCGQVNGFTVTSAVGSVDCEAALAMASAYTAAVLAPDAATTLGNGLFWGSEGWACARNYDDSGLTMNSHGLYCERGTTQVTLFN